MTFILVVSFLLIAFIGLLRYDIHKHRDRANKKPLGSEPVQRGEANNHNSEN